MAVDVKVPVLAESVAEATLLTWHRKVGDAVKRGDTLIDIETDKVTLEVAAPADGVLAEILKQDGATAVSDEVIARIDSAARAERPADKPAASAAAAPAPVPAKPVTPEQHALIASAPGTAEEPKLSPAVRALLDEHKLDPAQVAASGPGGRLTKEDVLKHIGAAAAPAPAPAAKKVETAPPPAPKPQPAAAPAARTAAPTPAPQPAAPAPQAAAPAVSAPTASASGRPEQRVPMTRLRRRAAERLLQAQTENAILTTFNEINMQPVTELRARYKEAFEQAHGVKLGFMSFFTKAATEALKKFPIINARVDGTDIIYHGYFDIGIAVGAARGLVVPILRDADRLSLAELEMKIREFAEKAKDGKLTMDDLTGGTFTITNGGVFGSLLSTPIINPPQSAILGMHKVQPRPVAENNAVVIRPMMYVAMSYDHRIIDGREAVQFLVTIKELIEDPSRLLLQV